jgi:hypothetical protein
MDILFLLRFSYRASKAKLILGLKTTTATTKLNKVLHIFVMIHKIWPSDNTIWVP